MIEEDIRQSPPTDGTEIRSQERRTETVSVLIPTYNESENIERAVTRTLDALAETGFGIEVLVLDDDSPDETWKIASETFATEPRVRTVRRRSNPGLSQAIIEGFQKATGEYCVVIDADLQHPPERIPDLLAELHSGADIAVGSRHVEGGGIENWPYYRRLLSRGATGIARAGVRDARGISDPLSGFFALRKDILDGVLLEPKGYKILLEIVAKCDVGTVVDVPYVFHERERGESNLTLSVYQKFLEHVGALTLFSYGFGERRSPMRMVRAGEFMLVGATGVVINIVIFALINSGLGLHYLAAGAAAYFGAVNWNFVGNWALTFNRPAGDLLEKFAKFHLVSAGGFVLYSALLALVIGVGNLPELVGNVAAITMSSLFKFIGTDEYVFTRESVEGRIPIEIEQSPTEND